jgi:hypothetical protein
MMLVLSLAGCAQGPGTRVETGVTIHTLECRPILEVRKVRDETRLGWHNELWLVLESAPMRIGTASGHARPEPPIPLDPAEAYTFTVERIETFSRIDFSLVSIARDGDRLWPP